MSFLQKDYKIPVSDNSYFKFQQGENNFRIMSSAVIGYEIWTNDKKPVRSREMFKKMPENIRLNQDGTWSQKHFWAFTVWNYEESKMQVMEITQKGIMKKIKAYVDNVKWGDPTAYDITITKSGEGLETEYQVMANPKTDLQAEIVEQFKAVKINLDALFTGGNPFDEAGSEDTGATEDTSKPTMSIDEQNEVLDTLDKTI